MMKTKRTMLFMVMCALACAISACAKSGSSTTITDDAGTATPVVVQKTAPELITVYGLEKSVSQYVFDRALEVRGEDPTRYVFKNMDPGSAAMAMQQRQADVEGIMVWNPFVIDTLSKRADAKVRLDSTAIPAEVIDMVVVAQASLDRPRGDAFAKAVAAAYYAVNRLLEDPATRDATLIAIGDRFSSQGLEGMRKVVEQTLFYKTPAWGTGLFAGQESFPFRSGVTNESFPSIIMPRVVDYVVRKGWVERRPIVAFGAKTDAPSADLRFDTAAMDAVGAALLADDGKGTTACADFPRFSLAWSEYPSWSVFGVAHARGIVNGDTGACGWVERAYGVDVELKEFEYDPCLTSYASSAIDAVCITNVDVLALSLGRPSVAIMPTSTSYGADAYLTTK